MLALTQTSAQAPTTATPSQVELLLCCARAHIDTTTAERIRMLLQKESDWAGLIESSVYHGVMPLLYQSLKTTCPEAVPKTSLAQLQFYFHTSKLHNQFLTSELLKLLNLFEEHGIKAIPFKGAILAVSAYGNLAFRTFGDLDILVHQQDFLRAKDLLLSHGYHSTQKWFLTEAQRVAVMQDMGEYSLASHDGRVNIDLHKRLVAGYLFTLSADLDYFWECLEPVSLLDQTVVSFRAEETLLYLCIHGAKSFWERLRIPISRKIYIC
jgi:hypothetical protein